MRHGNAGRKFNRTQSHRKAMLANLASSLVEHEQIPYRRLGTVILLPAAWVEREPTMPAKRR